MTSRSTLLASLLLLAAAPARAAGRTPYGGELRVAHPGPRELAEPALADSPLEATLLGLVTQPVCHLTPEGRPGAALALEPHRPSPQVVRLGLPAPAQTQALVRAWNRLTGPDAPSPYRALLFPLVGEGRQLTATGDTLELTLAFPWPDLERSLCHPALAPPRGTPAALGPFASTATAGAPQVLEARLAWPPGRPYVDRLRPQPTDERGLARLWSTQGTQVALGVSPEAGGATGAALYATYLAWSPRKVPTDFRQAVESALDREDLTRLFVRGPAEPMPHLLPRALLPQASSPRAPAPPALQKGRPVTLLHDADNEDQRAVAERLQVKLHDLGYAVALQPLPRAGLRERWASGEYEVMLHSLLLPPVPGPALAVVLDAAGRKDLLGVELPRIGLLPDAAARDTRARERALALEPGLPLLPLYAQGLALRSAPEVEGLVFDAQGLPRLDGVWLRPVAPSPGGRR